MRRIAIYGFGTLVGLILLLIIVLIISPPNPQPALTQQQIEQLALQYVRQNHNGTVDQMTVRKTTPRQSGWIPCPPFETMLIGLAAFFRLNEYNQCDPDRERWIIHIDGEFRWPHSNRVVDRMGLVFDTYGRFHSAGDIP